jgi:mono/diheme cytochrome c family protein
MKLIWFLCAAAAVAGLAPRAALASAFSERTGEALYRNICQGCHMSGARGAVGAGAYPALADDPNLQSPAYPVFMVVDGHGAMPAFGVLLDDDQIAAVVDYIRSHFGNAYLDATPSEMVRDARPKD